MRASVEVEDGLGGQGVAFCLGWETSEHGASFPTPGQ